jgi:uncharacterized protein (TIGR02271 family)
LYDSRAEAEAAKQRLSSAVDVDRIKIIDKDGTGGSGGGRLNDVYMDHEDRHAYGEGLRRGGFLLCAEVHSGEDPDKIVRLLEETSSVDLDERQQSWQREGWSPYASTTGASMTGTGAATTASTAGSFQGERTQGTSGSVVQEEHIPIVEEELRIGKREVNRGGARVRSFIREVPVHEQVTLREEHVNVERRPVQETTLGTSGASGDLLQERNIEMREVAEEAVVQKVAQVKEEVVVSKTVEEHQQQIDDTVRRTEVEIDEGARSGSGERSAFGSFGRDNDQDSQRTSDMERTNRDR